MTSAAEYLEADHRAPARRRTELGLIVMSVVLIGGLYVLAAEGRTGDLPADIGPFLAVMFVILLVGHLAVRKWAPEADPTMLPLAGMLNGLGYVFIARLSHSEAAAQATWSVVGMACFIAVLILLKRVRDLERYRYTFGAIGIILLLLPLVPGLGLDVLGGKLWIHVGSYEFQPGEIAKLALAIFFASALTDRAEQLSRGTKRIGGMLVIDPKYLAPVAGAWALSLVIFLAENDLGSSFLFFALFIGMLWIATNRAFYLALGLALFAGGAILALTAIGHAKTRIEAWINPWPHYLTTGDQILKGIFAVAGGGLWGTGIAQSNAGLIPFASSDMIFAVIAEEIGMIGAVGVLIIMMMLVGSGLRAAIRVDNQFEKLLAAGLAMILGVQTFVIVGGIVRLIPLTGITLPFVAYGGSSLISNYILLGILVRISDTSSKTALIGDLR